MKRLFIALFATLALPAGALQNTVGTATSEFLTLGAGGRSLGMGEAYTAVADGPDAAYWNPAGLATMKRPEVSYTNSQLPDGVSHDFAAVGVPVALLHGTIAAAFTRLSQDSLPQVTSSNQTVGSFAPHSEAYALAYGARLYNGSGTAGTRNYFDEDRNGTLAVGLSLKAISEDLGTREAATFAADGGVIYRPWDWDTEGLVFAGAFRNIGRPLRFISDSEPLPAELSASAAYDGRAGDWRLLPAIEADVPYAGNPYGKLGFEVSRPVTAATSAAARIGYNSQSAVDLGVLAGLTAGVGLCAGGFRFDAAFQPMSVLGESFRLSVAFAF